MGHVGHFFRQITNKKKKNFIASASLLNFQYTNYFKSNNVTWIFVSLKRIKTPPFLSFIIFYFSTFFFSIIREWDSSENKEHYFCFFFLTFYRLQYLFFSFFFSYLVVGLTLKLKVYFYFGYKKKYMLVGLTSYICSSLFCSF